MSQYPPPPGQYPPTPYAQTHDPNQKASGLAVGAMVCGIIGLLIFPVGIVGIILGIAALNQRRSPAEPGKGQAVTGIVCGSLGVLLLLPALLISILLPSLSRAREAANRIKCASNMKQIGLALKMYANDDLRTSKFPPDLAHLVTTQEIAVDSFICPASIDKPATGTTLGELKTELKHGSGCCSYIYVPGFTDNASADVILLYEPLTNHDGDGANFLMLDGHVEFQRKAVAENWIRQIQAGQNPPK